jgi:hypothetical protein
MAILLAFIGLATALGVFKFVRLDFGFGVPETLNFLVSQFKDIAYLHQSDSSDLLEKIWLGRGETKLLLGMVMSIMCFSCARLFAALLLRAKTAVIAGYLAGMGIFAIIIHCWIRLDLFGLRRCTGTRRTRMDSLCACIIIPAYRWLRFRPSSTFTLACRQKYLLWFTCERRFGINNILCFCLPA